MKNISIKTIQSKVYPLLIKLEKSGVEIREFKNNSKMIALTLGDFKESEKSGRNGKTSPTGAETFILLSGKGLRKQRQIHTIYNPTGRKLETFKLSKLLKTNLSLGF